MKSVFIIGAGNIGQAIAKGLGQLSNEYKLTIFDINKAKLVELSKEISFKTDCPKNSKKIDHDIILLAIKPHDLQSISLDLRKKISSDSLVISVLAGIAIEQIKSKFEFDGAIVRAMPNISALVSQAATAICCSANISKSQHQLAHSVFLSIGEVIDVEEKHLDAVTGLSGSGPAYIYLIIEALIEGGVKMGLTRNVASQLAIQTVLGAASLIKSTGFHPAILKDQVSTPGGTTIDALHELEKSGLRAILMSAVEVATLKSKKLREG